MDMEMQAKGKDGKWHPWEELTDEEREAWCKGQREADKAWERIKCGHDNSLRQNILEYEQKERFY